MIQEGEALAVGLEESPAKLAQRIKLGGKRATGCPDQIDKQLQSNRAYDHRLVNDQATFAEELLIEQRFYERACRYVDRRQYPLAISLLIRVLNRESGHAGAWYRLGYSFGELGRHKRAIECYDRAIKLAPTWGEGWSNRGWNRMCLRDNQGALQDLLQAVEIEPDSAIAWFHLGHAYSKLGLPEKSKESFERAGNLNPWMTKKWFELASDSRTAVDSPPQEVSPATVSVGRILRRENPLADERDAKTQDRLVRVWAAIQNPVAWIVIFVVAALLYTLIGN